MDNFLPSEYSTAFIQVFLNSVFGCFFEFFQMNAEPE